MKAISTINFNNLYISSDNKNHLIIKQIMEKYPTLQNKMIYFTTIKLSEIFLLILIILL